jgi:hypothetical protein
MIQVCVVIPFRGDPATLCWALDGFAEQRLPDDISLEVRVGGDGCLPPPYRPPIEQSGIHFAMSSLPRSGVAGAKNLLLDGVASDVLIFANADTRPAPEFVSAHVRRLLSLPEGSMVLGKSSYEVAQPATVFKDLKELTPMIFFYAQMNPHEFYDYRHAWNLNVSVRTNDFHRAGGFSTALRPYGYEDLDFAFKVMGEKRAVYYDPQAWVAHRHPMSLDDYLNREEALGSVAPALARVNPLLFRALFGRADLETLAAEYRVWTSMDIASHRWIYRRLREWTDKPQAVLGATHLDQGDGVLMALYQMHIPLKRLAFRLGFLRGMDLLDDSRWLERGSRELWKRAIE